jgi:His-Xaa-Ser system protein HxsD
MRFSVHYLAAHLEFEHGIYHRGDIRERISSQAGTEATVDWPDADRATLLAFFSLVSFVSLVTFITFVKRILDMEFETASSFQKELSAIVPLERNLYSAEAILKACYWLSRDFSCKLSETSPELVQVTITPRNDSSVESLEWVKGVFLASVTDFALREKIEAKTSGIRDLLLAKAFSESGVLEDSPHGVFGDKIEEEKPHGLFKILSNSEN